MPALTVLVVDDDVLIGHLLETALGEGGYSVVYASSGRDAISLLDAHHMDYRAVITDVNMGPDLPTGWDVARRARELNGEMPIIYTTGDSAKEWSANGVPNSILIQKPFAEAQVVTAVSHLLNSAGPTGD